MTKVLTIPARDVQAGDVLANTSLPIAKVEAYGDGMVFRFGHGLLSIVRGQSEQVTVTR